MATDHDHHHLHHADVSYEKTDLGHRGILAFFAFLAISALVTFIAMGALYKGFGYAENKLAAPMNPMAKSNATQTSDRLQNTAMVDLNKYSDNGKQPLLQVDEPADLAKFREEEEMFLNAAPWKDDKGNVHIPIEDAMKAVSQRSLPARANGGNPSEFDPKTIPTEQGFAAVALVQQQADASNAEQPEAEGAAPNEKPETHSIPPTGKRSQEMPEKKK